MFKQLISSNHLPHFTASVKHSGNRLLIRCVCCLLVLSLTFAVQLISTQLCLADDIIVNNVSGDDRADGRAVADVSQSSGPVRTIGRALRLAGPGDRIVVQKTRFPYNESLSVSGAKNSGTKIQPFTIVSDGAILDGTSVINPAAWEHVDGNVFRFAPELKSHQQLYLDGRPVQRVWPEKESQVPKLSPNQWALVGGHVYFCTDGQTRPADYGLRYSKFQTGITLYEVHDVVIEGLVIQGFQLDGINAHDAVQDTVIQNCKLRGNGRSGFSVGGASRATVRQSTLGGNSIAQIRSEGYCQLKINDCQILEAPNTGPALDRQGGRVFVDGRNLDQGISLHESQTVPANRK